MKIKGKDVKAPDDEVVVIPRKDGDIVFICKAVMNYDACEKLNPMPHPPRKQLPGDGGIIENVEDPAYLEKLQEWSARQGDWMILESLKSTEGLVWETVKMDDPLTWGNYRDELAKSFTPGEVIKIVQAVSIACGLSQARIDEATKRFLAGAQDQPSE